MQSGYIANCWHQKEDATDTVINLTSQTYNKLFLSWDLEPCAEMISSKVVLTYQRKRSSARVEAGHGTETKIPHSESPVNIPVNASNSSYESSTKDQSVNHNRGGEDGSNGQLTDSASSESTDSGRSGLLQDQGQDQDQDQDPRSEPKCLSKRSDVGPIMLCSHKLFLTPKCGQSASQTFVKDSDSSWVVSSTERNCAAECEGLTKSEKCSPETNYHVKSTSSFSTDLHKKFRNPLITFSRRSKKKESMSRSENQTCNSELSPKDVVLSLEVAGVNPLPVQRQDKIASEEDGGCKSSDTGTVCELTNLKQESSTHIQHSLDQCPSSLKAEPTGLVQEYYHPARCDEISSLTCGMENSFSAARDFRSSLPKHRASTGEAPRILSMNEDKANLELSVAPPNAMNLDVSRPSDEVAIKRKKVEHCSSMLSMNMLNQEERPKSLSGEVLNEVFPVTCRSPKGTTSRIDLQGRIFPPHLDQSQSKQSLMKSSHLPPHFLDLSLPINPGTPVVAIQNSSCMLSPSSFSSTNCRTQSATDEKASSDRRRQLLDNILHRVGMFKANQVYSSENLRAYTSMWSEEELDSLWIGVRRHGRNNWNVMLRDPKLHFSNWRTAEDLAEQWVQEQSKLLNGSKHCQPMTLSKADLITCGRVASKNWSIPTLWNGATETHLSLGDVYGQKDGAVLKKYPFHFSQPYSPPHMKKSPVLCRSELSQQKPYRGQRNRLYTDSKRGTGLCDLQEKTGDKLAMFNHGVSKRNLCEAQLPINDDFSSDLQEKGILPHWLREVTSVPSRPSESTLPPNVSALTRSVSLSYNENPVIPSISNPGLFTVQSKDSIKLPRKKDRISCRTGCLRVTERSASKTPDVSGTDISWMEAGLNLFPGVGSSPLNTVRKVLDHSKTVGQDQVENTSDLLSPNHPIVVDSDASSEETISDDQSGREC